jgi:hypothetical protein
MPVRQGVGWLAVLSGWGTLRHLPVMSRSGVRSMADRGHERASPARQTDANGRRMFIGRCDVALDATGRKQARAATLSGSGIPRRLARQAPAARPNGAVRDPRPRESRAAGGRRPIRSALTAAGPDRSTPAMVMGRSSLGAIVPGVPHERFRRAYLCRTSASIRSRPVVHRAAGRPECATPPEDVYARAKARGMGFVTLTSRGTLDGALAITDPPDVFVSEELTATQARDARWAATT